MIDRSARPGVTAPLRREAPAGGGDLTGRLFVALWPSPAVRRGLAALQGAIGWPEAARPVPAQDLHLTLVFIGPIPVAQLGLVGEVLAFHAPAFDMTIDAVQRWHAGLTVAVPTLVPDAVRQRQQQVAQALKTLGLPLDDRPYRPHVTLARRGTGASLPAESDLSRVPWHGAGHVLAVRDGAHYRVIRRYA